MNKVDEIGREAINVVRQRTRDLKTLLNDPLFDQHTFLPPGSPLVTREDAIKTFLVRWNAVNVSRQPAKNFSSGALAKAFTRKSTRTKIPKNMISSWIIRSRISLGVANQMVLGFRTSSSQPIAPSNWTPRKYSGMSSRAFLLSRTNIRFFGKVGRKQHAM